MIVIRSERISDGYLESYAEIPGKYIEDDYIAAKKLGGHRRLFDPGDIETELDWLEENKNNLIKAYGQERLNRHINYCRSLMDRAVE